MTSSRLSSRTAAGTLAGLMGASLLLPALTAKAAPLEFDCYSRTTQELLVKAAYDMSNGGMACLKSSASGASSNEASTAAAETPAEAVATETASASTENSEGNGTEASLPAENAPTDTSANANSEASRAPGLGAVIFGGIVNSLMDRLLDRLLPGGTGDAAAVDSGVIDGEADVVDAAVVDPGMAAAEAEAPIEPQQQSDSGRPIPNFGSLVNKTSIIPGLVKQAPVKPMPRPQRPSWFGTKRPSFKPLPGPMVNKPVFTRPNFGAVNSTGLTKVSNLSSKPASTPLPNFSGLRTLR